MSKRRVARSHIRADGTAKTPFSSRQAALEEAERLHVTARRELHPYECHLRPSHWHLGSGIPDLVAGDPLQLPETGS